MSQMDIQERRRGGAGKWIAFAAIGCTGVVILAILAVTLVAGVGWWMWTSTPDYWQANQQALASTTREEQERMADDAFNRLTATFTAASNSTSRQPGNLHASDQQTPAGDGAAAAGERDADRTVKLTYQEVNAWLATRLKDWLANQGATLPKEVRDFMVAKEGGNLVVAFEFDTPQLQQVVSLVLDVGMTDEGLMRVGVVRVRGGTLPLPIEELLQGIRDSSPDAVSPEDIDRLTSALDGQTFEPEFKIDGSRTARITYFKMLDDGVEVTARVQ